MPALRRIRKLLSRGKYVYLEPETLNYLKLSGASTDWFTINENIKAVKYGSGKVLAALTCNLSLVNGTAFITNPSVDLRQYVGFKITLNDGTQDLVGWIKAVGTGQTLDSELLNDTWTNNVDPWETLTLNGKDILVAANTAGGEGGCTESITTPTVVGGLYLWAMNLVYNSGSISIEAFPKRTAPYAYHYMPTRPYQAGAADRYVTTAYICDAFTVQTGNSLATNITLTQSFKQVLLPSATGVRIVSVQGGSIYNWTSDGGIDPNAASFTGTITRS